MDVQRCIAREVGKDGDGGGGHAMARQSDSGRGTGHVLDGWVASFGTHLAAGRSCRLVLDVDIPGTSQSAAAASMLGGGSGEP